MKTKPLTAAARAEFVTLAYLQEREFLERRNGRRSVESKQNEAALRAVHACEAIRRAARGNGK